MVRGAEGRGPDGGRQDLDPSREDGGGGRNIAGCHGVSQVSLVGWGRRTFKCGPDHDSVSPITTSGGMWIHRDGGFVPSLRSVRVRVVRGRRASKS